MTTHCINHYLRKEFLYDTFFLLCSYFRAHPATLLLKILGGRMHGPSPHLKFWGDRPPVPLGLLPCAYMCYMYEHCISVKTLFKLVAQFLLYYSAVIHWSTILYCKPYKRSA